MKRTLLLFTALALFAAACGGSDDSSDVVSLAAQPATAATAAEEPANTDAEADADSDSGTAPVDEEDAMIAFTACLRDNGLDIADPTVDADGNVQLSPPEGFNDPGFDQDAALEALDQCQNELEGVNLGFTDDDGTGLQDTMVEFASCMRDNGYDMDDPDLANFGPGGGGGGPFGDIDDSDPAYQSAFATCGDILSGLGGIGQALAGGGS